MVLERVKGDISVKSYFRRIILTAFVPLFFTLQDAIRIRMLVFDILE